MSREDEICLVLQGLINGIDPETGKKVEFSEKVKDSLKVIAASFGCRERCKKINKVEELKKPLSHEWSLVEGSFIEIIQEIKKNRSNHLVIIQNGYFYEVLNEDATYFKNNFSYNTFERHGATVTGFPIYSQNVIQDLKGLNKPFVIVGQLPNEASSKVQRAIIDSYDGTSNKKHSSDSNIYNNNDKSDSNSGSSKELNVRYCKDCNQKIPGARIHKSPYAIRCKQCQLSFQKLSNRHSGSSVKCNNCGSRIPQARLDASPNTSRCVSCQSQFENNNPESFERKAEDKSILTREGAKRMRAKQYGTNIKNKI
jgi:RNA polymerase-binding transcription factor DksA